MSMEAAFVFVVIQIIFVIQIPDSPGIKKTAFTEVALAKAVR